MGASAVALAACGNGLAAVAYAGFALRLVGLGYLRSPRSSTSLALLGTVIACAAWAALRLGYVLQPQLPLAALATLADLLRFGGWYVFVWLLFRPVGGNLLPHPLRWTIPLAMAVWFFSLLSVGAVWARIGPTKDLLRGIEFGWMAMPLLGLVLVEQLFRNVAEDSRWNVKPLCLGLAGAFVFDAYVYSQSALFSRIDPDSLTVRGAVHALMVPLLMLSIARRGDWIAHLRISRKAAFHSATLLIAGVYLLIVSSIGYYLRFFGGQIGGALQQIVLVAALIALAVLAISGASRARLRVFVEKHFFRYRYDYREEWLKFTQTLSSQHSPKDMGQQVIRGLADMLESPAGGLWTKGPSEDSFAQVARWNIGGRAETESPSSPFCRFLAERGWVVNLDELRASPERYERLELPPWLALIPQAWLIVPLKVGDELTGFVVLASPRTPMDVNWEVNDLLKTAGRQAASFLAQMQATEALLEAHKFDAFNRMSAFVVHDLKNIVTQLSLMMKNAKRLHANPEFQQDMLMTVENSLDRMRQLMLQLREGTTPAGTSFGVDLAAVTERIVATAAGRGKTLDVRRVERVSTRGDDERLERIIGHVVQNAFDATEPSGQVWLTVDRLGGQARVQVGDNGHGMSQEFMRQRLFKPFQTTKQTGMGIGAYESFQYVRELGGKILVESEPDRGTLVTLLLPLFHADSDFGVHLRQAS